MTVRNMAGKVPTSGAISVPPLWPYVPGHVRPQREAGAERARVQAAPQNGAAARTQNSGHGENIQLIGEASKHRHLAKPRCIAAGQRLAGSQVEL